VTDLLIDSSVWIDHFRAAGGRADLTRALDARSVVICGPIAGELLSGVRGEPAILLGRRLRGLRWIAMVEPTDWFSAADLRARSAARGRPVALLDALIAALASRVQAQLWTLDRDFEAIAEVAGGLDLRILPA